MSLTYAIADLHGRFDLLTAAFDAIVKHAAERSFKIITLGDYVDRGPQSRQIIDHLMAAQEMGVSLICLKGMIAATSCMATISLKMDQSNTLAEPISIPSLGIQAD